jgi:hypothetical protein
MLIASITKQLSSLCIVTIRLHVTTAACLRVLSSRGLSIAIQVRLSVGDSLYIYIYVCVCERERERRGERDTRRDCQTLTRERRRFTVYFCFCFYFLVCLIGFVCSGFWFDMVLVCVFWFLVLCLF